MVLLTGGGVSGSFSNIRKKPHLFVLWSDEGEIFRTNWYFPFGRNLPLSDDPWACSRSDKRDFTVYLFMIADYLISCNIVKMETGGR